MRNGTSVLVLIAGFCALAILFDVVGCASTNRARDLSALGVVYQVKELDDPRPNRVHILRVDLSLGKAEPVVIIAADPDGDGPIDAALTNPLKLATNFPILAFVNSNPWEDIPDTNGERNRRWHEGQSVDILGLAASGGQTRSQAQGGVSVWVDAQGRVLLSADGPGNTAVIEGTAGFQPIVREGAVVEPPGGDPHPRTAVGLDRSGSMMWLVVVDGRQENYSEGMNFHELGNLMQELGCWEAANMDGGGSSIMGLAGNDASIQIMNSPSDRRLGIPRIRPLPSILAIRQKQATLE
jgi:hypothetical protein